MIPTILSGLLVGVETALWASIKSLAAWVVGSVIVVGNQFFDTTYNATPTVYRGTSQAIALTQSGVGLMSNATIGFQTFATPCTSTGGLKKYPTCITRNPFGSTGAVLDVAVDCGNTNQAFSLSGAFVKTPSGNDAGQVLPRVTVGTGALKNRLALTGAQLIWNSADFIRVSTVTANGTAANCTMWVTARDKSGT